MGLYKYTPPMSGRMAALWSLASVRQSVVIEYGCMGHMNYGRMFLHRMGVLGGQIYSTHLSETDIAMGDWSRLRRAVGQITRQNQPKAVFLLPSAVPEIVGTDLKAIAHELASEYPDVRMVPVSCGGFDADGGLGVERVLLQLAQVFPKDQPKTEKPSFNLIGSCADMFNYQADAAELCRILDGALSMKPVCILTSTASISDMERMPAAHINLVIRREGESAARHLHQRFGTPYLTLRPYGIAQTGLWINEIAALCALTARSGFIDEEAADCSNRLEPARQALGRYLRMHRGESSLILAGHADVVEGIAHFESESALFSTRELYCDREGMSNDKIAYLDERAREAVAVKKHGFLMGDEPLLTAAGRHESLQIANPSSQWISGFEAPLLALRGAVNLSTILANEMARKL